jgi:peptide chain release factor subunit 1
LSKKRSSLSKFKLKRTLDILADKEGRHTELVSLYVPDETKISDVMNNLRQELSTASNIKSKSTKKNVQDAIEKVMQRLRLFPKPPKNGLVIFSGAIPQNGPGSERIETYVIEPHEPTPIYYYRCDSRFHLEPLQEMLREKDTYGIVLIDGNNTTIATLRGRNLNIKDELASGLPGKHGRGGQSQRRFERLRETQVNEYYKRVARHADKILLQINDLKGIIIGGPGPTKGDFEDREYLHYTLRDKIVAIVDTAYVGEQGLKEVLDKSSKLLSEVRYVEEKKLFQDFLYEIGHDTGLATYGEEEVRKNLDRGAVKLLLLSEDLNKTRINFECTNCGNIMTQTLDSAKIVTAEETIVARALVCAKCSNSTLTITEKKDLIDNLTQIAEKTNTDVELISTRTEEGIQLKESFGGIAAILHY